VSFAYGRDSGKRAIVPNPVGPAIQQDGRRQAPRPTTTRGERVRSVVGGVAILFSCVVMRHSSCQLGLTIEMVMDRTIFPHLALKVVASESGEERLQALC